MRIKNLLYRKVNGRRHVKKDAQEEKRWNKFHEMLE